MQLKNHHILIVILLVSAVLRFWDYFSIPFSHDEFSAFFRTGFNDFGKLIEKGVKTDTHPAGVQVFMNYWRMLFGSEPWIMKLPFTLMGIASVYLIYKLGKFWFSETSGLMSAAFLAVLQYQIHYSQLTRPYISGMFLGLVMVWFWSHLVTKPEKNFWKNGVAFALAAAACAYNHHFSLLFAAIVGFSGIYFLPLKHMLKYVGLGLLIFLLYLPHLSIFLGQLKQGGVGGEEGWLAAPELSFFTDFVNYLFHFSFEFLLLSLGIIVIGALLRKEKRNFKILLFFLLWFILPAAIGYAYSVYKNPVLQYSVLIFGFPFLLLGLTGLMKKFNTVLSGACVILILTLGSLTLIFERQHFKVFYNSPYKEILLDQNEAFLVNSNCIRIIDNYPKINAHYNKTLNIDTNYIHASSFQDERDLLSFLEVKSKTNPYLFFGQYARGNSLLKATIENHYALDSVCYYEGGASYWYFIGGRDQGNLLSNSFNHEEEHTVRDSTSYMNRMKFVDRDEFCLGKTFELDNYSFDKTSFIELSLEIKPQTAYSEVFLTSLVLDGDSTVIYGSTNIHRFDLVSEWIHAKHLMSLKQIPGDLNGKKLKVYVWNKDKIPMYVDNWNISVRPGNPMLYSLYQKIERHH